VCDFFVAGEKLRLVFEASGLAYMKLVLPLAIQVEVVEECAKRHMPLRVAHAMEVDYGRM
tara:strand:+ start:455 stop:634 length:180 start_codon:yes stop_codon:yes gene_type:complete